MADATNGSNNNGDTLGLIGGLLGGSTTAFGNVANVVQGIKNWEAQDNENAHKWAWTSYMNDQTKEREDSAIQRRVRDLRAAGLSPTLAAGSGATQSVISAPSTQAPQMNIGRMGNPVSDGYDTMAKYLMLKQTQSSINQTEAETALKKQQLQQNDLMNPKNLESKQLQNELARNLLPIKTDQATEEVVGMRLDNYLKSALQDTNIAMAKQKLNEQSLNVINARLDNTLKQLGITQRELDIVKQKATQQASIGAAISEYDIKLLAIKSMEIANKTASSKSSSAASQAMIDLQNAEYWRKHGISSAESANTARYMQLLLGAAP